MAPAWVGEELGRLALEESPSEGSASGRVIRALIGGTLAAVAVPAFTTLSWH